MVCPRLTQRWSRRAPERVRAAVSTPGFCIPWSPSHHPNQHWYLKMQNALRSKSEGPGQETGHSNDNGHSSHIHKALHLCWAPKCSISFNSPRQPRRVVCQPPLYRRESRGSERKNSWPQVIPGETQSQALNPAVCESILHPGTATCSTKWKYLVFFNKSAPFVIFKNGFHIFSNSSFT